MLVVISAFLVISCASSKEEDWWETQQKLKTEKEAEASKPVEEPPAAEEAPKEPAPEAPPPPTEEPVAMAEPVPLPPPPPPPEPKAESEPAWSSMNLGEPIEISRATGVAPGVASISPYRAVQIAVMASPHQPQAADRMVTVLGLHRSEQLEATMGRRVELAFVSRSSQSHGPTTQIRYRQGFVKVALRLAAMLPQKQEVLQMSPAEQRESVVDVMIYLGDSVR